MFENPIIVEIAKKYNKSARQVALRFLTQSGVGVIPKTTNIERMKENFNIFDFELTSDEIEKLKSIDTPPPSNRLITGLYNRPNVCKLGVNG